MVVIKERAEEELSLESIDAMIRALALSSSNSSSSSTVADTL